MTAADGKFYDIFINFQGKYALLFHINCLPADDSHEISTLIWFLKILGRFSVCCIFHDNLGANPFIAKKDLSLVHHGVVVDP